MAKMVGGPPASDTLLQARGIVKVVGSGSGEFTVLKGVDLDLRAGELTLLMGPSGSGKTTLLSILGCILTPTSGSLNIAGTSIESLSVEDLARVRRKHVGFVFQSYNLFPTLTAIENVMMAMEVRGGFTAEAAQGAAKALAAVGLTHRTNIYPSKLSGGEKQRVAIARALAGSPSVILADEPTAALDSENGKAVMALMAEVARDQSRAVLAVTHDHRTLDFADRIIWIEDGKIGKDEHRTRPVEATVDEASAAQGEEQHGPISFRDRIKRYA
jgi:putative ABC transport system ATP-binding protein